MQRRYGSSHSQSDNIRSVSNTTFRPLYHQKTLGILYTGRWVDFEWGLEGNKRSCPHRDLISGPCTTYPVAIPTKLSQSLLFANEAVTTKPILKHFLKKGDS
jgi:hypothetical protein